MAFSVNKQIILGRVGSEAELRYTQSGKAVTDLSVATSEKWNGNEKTEWHKVTFWSPLAEIVVNNCRKGDRIYIEGRTETEEWTDRDGNTRKTKKVIARDVVLLGREERREATTTSGSGGYSQTGDRSRGNGYGGGYTGGGSAKHVPGAGGYGGDQVPYADDEDIPFRRGGAKAQRHRGTTDRATNREKDDYTRATGDDRDPLRY